MRVTDSDGIEAVGVDVEPVRFDRKLRFAAGTVLEPR